MPPKKGRTAHAGEGIRVGIRVRIFNEVELKHEGGAQAAIDAKAPSSIVVKGDDATDDRTFSYDHVLTSDPTWPCYGTQEECFQLVGTPVIDNALQAYNGCIFAYGQTGSGKSYSMQGNPKSEQDKGMMPRACESLFAQILAEKESSRGVFQCDVMATYLEIYNENIKDLLTSNPAGGLKVQMHPALGPHVQGLTEAPVQNFDDVEKLMDFGQAQRVVAATQMNATSSRSHAIFTIELRMVRKGKDSNAKVYFVDLAGSERAKKTGAAGDRFKEGVAINQSLSVLGKVIAALTSGVKGTMPPFRDSNLTKLLKEALSGNSKTVLLACISPSTYNAEETLSTLEFASRCKMIKTHATKNEVDKRDLIDALEAEKSTIQAQLEEEREAREAILSLVDQEKEKYARLQAEMEAIQRELAKKSEEDIKESQAAIQRERDAAQAALAEAQMKLESAAQADKAEMEKMVQKLQAEVAEKAAVQAEREEALRQAKEAQQQLDEIRNERKRAQDEFEAERARIAAEKAADHSEATKALVKLEEERAKMAIWEEQAQERERELELRAQKALQDAKHEVEAQSEQIEAERKAAHEEAAAAKKARDDMDEQLKKEREAREATENEMRQRLEELRQQTEQSEVQKTSEFDRLLQERVDQEKQREAEMLAKHADLQSRLDSLQVSREELEHVAREQKEERERALAELGYGSSGLSEEERKLCPRLLNLHADSSLTGGLVFYLPRRPVATASPKDEESVGQGLGGVFLGSDPEKCQIRVEGLGIGPLMCELRNDSNERVFVIPKDSGQIRVNGKTIRGRGRELRDGDRLAIGRAYIFQVEIPVARVTGSSTKQKAEERFQAALAELEASSELDPRWKNGVNSALHVVKQELGPEAANALLEEARKASVALVEANDMIECLPRSWRRGITGYDLGVLFDAGGLPIISVIARRERTVLPTRPARRESLCSISSGQQARDAADVDNIWPIGTFVEQQLPVMREAYEEWQRRPTAVLGDEDWEARAWGRVPLDAFRTAVHAKSRALMKITEEDEEEEEYGFLSFFKSIGTSQRKRQKRKEKPAEVSWMDWIHSSIGHITDAGAQVRGAMTKQLMPPLVEQLPKAMAKPVPVAAIMSGEAGGKNATSSSVHRREPKKRLTKEELIEVGRLFPGGKLGIKLKDGLHVCGFDVPEAANFGWMQGDVITKVNGIAVGNRTDFGTQLKEARERLPIHFAVQRRILEADVGGHGAGHTPSASSTAARPPSPPPAPAAFPSSVAQAAEEAKRNAEYTLGKVGDALSKVGGNKEALEAARRKAETTIEKITGAGFGLRDGPMAVFGEGSSPRSPHPAPPHAGGRPPTSPRTPTKPHATSAVGAPASHSASPPAARVALNSGRKDGDGRMGTRVMAASSSSGGGRKEAGLRESEGSAGTASAGLQGFRSRQRSVQSSASMCSHMFDGDEDLEGPVVLPSPRE